MNSLTQNNLNQEQAIKNFLRDYMNKTKDGQKICSILDGACKYYDADRSYIFEQNSERTKVSNTYEHCREGVSAEMDNLQNISLDGLECLFEALEEKGELYIPSLSESFATDSKIYRILEPQRIESLAVAPLVVNGSVTGFLGVDNPRRNTAHLLLLSVIASACCSEIANKRLEDSNKVLMERMKIIQSMSEIYTSVYYVDLARNHYTELASIDNVHDRISSSGNAQETLNFFCRNMMLPEYTAEVLDFVDLSTLDKRLSGNRIMSKQFLCTVPPLPRPNGYSLLGAMLLYRS